MENNNVFDEEERRDLMFLVVEAYDVFIDRVVDLQSLSYSAKIDVGILGTRLKKLNNSMLRLYYLVNIHVDASDIIEEYGKLVSTNITKMSPKQCKTLILAVLSVIDTYQKRIGKSGLLPLLKERIEDIV